MISPQVVLCHRRISTCGGSDAGHIFSQQSGITSSKDEPFGGQDLPVVAVLKLQISPPVQLGHVCCNRAVAMIGGSDEKLHDW